MSKVILFSGDAEHGKTASAILLKKKLESINKKCLIVNFADYLKYICKQYFGWDGNKDKIGREKLQFIGTDIVRKKNSNFWAETVVNFVKVFEDQYDYFLIGDCRFPNEQSCFKERGIDTLSIKVFRNHFENKLTPEQRMHSSERALDGYNFDYIITSESGLDNLSIEINKLFNKYVGIYW